MNLLDYQKLLKLLIISFILMTLTFYSRVILYGEIRGQSLFGKLEGNRDQNQHEIRIPKDVKSGLYLKAVTYQGEV